MVQNLQVGVASSLLSANPAILELGEMALEKRNLVLVCGAGHVCAGAFDGKVVKDCSLVDGGFGLGNQLCAPHVAVPLCGVVDCDFGALLAAGVAGVLVVGREVHYVKSVYVGIVFDMCLCTVAGGWARSVNVVLVVFGKCQFLLVSR